MGKLDNKVALITGAAQGIGKSCAEMLVEAGAQVVLADVQQEEGQKAATEIGEKAAFRNLDATSEADWQETCDWIVDTYGRLDILVNNAGISPASNIEDTSLEFWRKVMSLNVDGVFLGCKYGIGAMKKAGNGGSIINMSSGAAMRANGNLTAYNTSKAAVAMMTKSVALHCGQTKTGIRCNSVHPGTIRTRMVTDYVDTLPDPAAALEAMSSGSVIGRLGEPEDVAQMVLYLASDESSFITGSEMVVDGGMIL